MLDSSGSSSESFGSLAELNLAYLVLAQRLLAEDLDIGAFRLGINREIAEIIGRLSLSQTVKLASSPSLLCAFRMNDSMLLSSLAEKRRVEGSTHAAILLANSRTADAFA
jgi:flagellar transcriptional activator FlhD